MQNPAGMIQGEPEGYNSLRVKRNNFSEAEFDALSFAAVPEALRSLEMCFFDDLVFFATSPPESGVPGPLPIIPLFIYQKHLSSVATL